MQARGVDDNTDATPRSPHVPARVRMWTLLSVDCLTWVRTGCSATLTDAYATIAMHPELDEDVNTESVDCLAWVQTVWFNCRGLVWVPDMGPRSGLRLRLRLLRACRSA